MAKRTKTKVGVTGSSGFLGKALVDHLRSVGFDVVEFRRTLTEEGSQGDVRHFDLSVAPKEEIFRGVTCLVHAAWDLRETDPRRAWENNVEGSRRLLNAAALAGVERIVFVSSMSAYFGTKQDYGLMKLAIERSVLEANQLVIRPGLVYGGKSGGMALTLSKLARLPVIPIFRGSRLFTLHIDDFTAAVTTLIVAEGVRSGVIGLACETATPFREIMLALSPRTVQPRMLQNIPWLPVLGVLRVLERLKVPLPVRSDSLLGLVRPATYVPGRDVTSGQGISFREFAP
jgi:nucleoside-diphosphate-sugar epimerase